MKINFASTRAASINVTGATNNDSYAIGAVLSVSNVPSAYSAYNTTNNGDLASGWVNDKDGQTLCTFSHAKNLSISYLTNDKEVQAEIIKIIQDFSESAKAYAESVVLSAEELAGKEV